MGAVASPQIEIAFVHSQLVYLLKTDIIWQQEITPPAVLRGRWQGFRTAAPGATCRVVQTGILDYKGTTAC